MMTAAETCLDCDQPADELMPIMRDGVTEHVCLECLLGQLVGTNCRCSHDEIKHSDGNRCTVAGCGCTKYRPKEKTA